MAGINNHNNYRKFKRQSSKRLFPVRVTDIILDENHPAFQKYGGYDSIGIIFFSLIDEEVPNKSAENPNIAKPLYSYIKQYPLKNEIVMILTAIDKEIYNSSVSETTYYLPPVNIWNHPHHNALPDIRDLKKDQTSDDYSETTTGIVRRVKDGGTDIELGDYFEEKINVKPLTPFEGDFILEGRFGNSIRLGSTNDTGLNDWSNLNENENLYKGNPITIIRNGQTLDTNDKSWEHIIENINGDFTSIYLTSNQSISNLKTAGVPTTDELSISWPSFGTPDVAFAVTRAPQPTPNENIEDVSNEEVQEIVEGEEEIEETASYESPYQIISELPQSETDGLKAEIEKFVHELFGEHLTLDLLAGVDKLYEIYYTEAVATSDGDTRNVYYPYKTDGLTPTHTITANKLIEIMHYYKVKPRNKPAFYAGLAKEMMDMNIAEGYFRPHYIPLVNSIHIPTHEGHLGYFKDAVAEGGITEEELDLAIRTMRLDDVWAEVAHAADIDINGLFGYKKDDVGGETGEWFKSLFDGKTRRKGTTDPEGILIPENFSALNEEQKQFVVLLEETTEWGPGLEPAEEGKFYIELIYERIPHGVMDIDGGVSSDRQLIMRNPFGANTGTPVQFTKDEKGVYSYQFSPSTTERSGERVLEFIANWGYQFLQRYYPEAAIKLKYFDRNLVGDLSYDNINHFEGRTHNIVEPQLAQEWLEGYDAQEDLQQNLVIKAVSPNITTVENLYNQKSEAAGISTPPYKYYNKATGEYTFMSEEFEVPEENTVIGVGVDEDANLASLKAKKEASDKAEALDAVLGNYIIGEYKMQGGEITITDTYLIEYKE
tara:strand:+ start:634 stop:3117 length:2484 start_codon:yes stop_codon:yes gene_type:complete